MPKPKRLFVDGPHGQIHVRIATPAKAAKQPPLVCLHMFPQSGRNFVQFLEAASVDRVVIAPDFPGHGESDAPAEPIAAEEYAQSIWAAVDAMGLLNTHGAIDLFGVHAGAKLAVETAYQRPDDVRKIVLSSAAVLYPNEIAALKKSFQPIPLDEEGTRFKHLWNLIIRNRRRYMTYDICAASFAEILRGGEKYEWGHDAVFNYNVRFPERLAAITHPVALLNPKDELYDMTLRSMDYLQNVELFDFPQWSHGYIEAYSHEVAELVRQWLDQDPAQAPSKVAMVGA